MSGRLGNPLAATNRVAYDDAYNAAVNLSVLQLEERIRTDRTALDAAVREAGEDFDVSAVVTLKADTPQETLGRMIDTHSGLSAYYDLRAQKLEIMRSARQGVLPNAVDPEDPAAGITQHFHASRHPRVSAAVDRAMAEAGIGSYLEAAQRRQGFDLDIDAAVVTTAAGYAPESLRIPRVEMFPAFRFTALDIIPMGSTSQAAIKYMAEDQIGHEAATRSEGAVLAEETFGWSERTETVRSIGAFVPVTMEQLEDASMVRGMLDNRMLRSVRSRLNQQILGGNNTAPNLKGFHSYGAFTAGTAATASQMNKRDISQANYTLATAGKGFMTEARKLITEVEVNGATMCTHMFVHPNAWQQIQLQETTSAGFYMGDPRFDFGSRLWGLPVIEDTYWLTCVPTTTEGFTATNVMLLVGNFIDYCELFLRQGVRIEFGERNDDFTRLLMTLRAYVRAAMAIYRIKAFGHLLGAA